MQRAASSLFLDLAKAALCAVLMLLFLEFSLRAAGVRFAASFFTPDPVLGFSMRPHAEGWNVEENPNYVA